MSLRKGNKVGNEKSKIRKKNRVEIKLENVVDLIKVVIIVSVSLLILSFIGLIYVNGILEARVAYTMVIVLNLILSTSSITAYILFNKKINNIKSIKGEQKC